MDDPSKPTHSIFYRLSKKAVKLVDRFKMGEHSFVLTVSVIIGILGGFGAVGIQYTIKEFELLFWSGKFNLQTINEISWIWKLAIPAGGGIFVGMIIQFISREAKGHGVPEVMEAIVLRNGVIRPRVVVAKLLASALCIASGGSVGREGPVIQIGSAMGSTLGQFFRVNPRRMRTFVACGAASGIAAAFNAPVAGALFAVEVILGDFAVPQFSPVVISSVMATVVSRHFLGDFPAFVVPKYHLQSPVELAFYLVLGFLAGGVALLFIKTLYSFEGFFDRKKWPEPAKAGLGGLGIGVVGIVFPQIFGIGYDTITTALNGTIIWQMALGLVFLKIFSTSLSLGSGGSGGIFAPSLFLGAMLGSFYGSAVAYYFPALDIYPGAYALVAMGAVVAAATHGPIASILIIFEMSNDYKIILPLMITCIISTLIAIRVNPESIYTLKLKLRGINLFGGREINVLKSLKVSDIYKTTVEIIPESEPFPRIVDKLSNSLQSNFYVTDKEERIIGSVSLNEIRQTIVDYENLKNILIASDIMNPEVITVSLDENLDDVMKKFGRYNLDVFPVVSSQNGSQVRGSIWQQDVIEVYNRQIFLRDMSGELSGGIHKTLRQRLVPVFENYHLIEIEAPNIFVGKTLRDLNLRSEFGAEVILIKKNPNRKNQVTVHPDANYRIEYGDTLLVFGEKNDLQKLEKT
jgi:CIC family chloride channel protein